MTRLLRRPLAALIVGLTLALGLAPSAARPGSAAPSATVTVIAGAAGSQAFGSSSAMLPNGNIVIADQLYDDGATSNVGAVYLYDGATFELISTLKGVSADDQVGSNVILLGSGNFVVNSQSWDNGAAADAGAVTWCSAVSGCSGVVSAANSLVGTAASDQVGAEIIKLTNGNYVVRSPLWDNGALVNAGSATWCSGVSGCSGVVSAANSLVGAATELRVSSGGVLTLPNGNYVVRSPSWDNGAAVDAGAATWADGAAGLSGAVSAANSLVGSSANDKVGSGIGQVGASNYVVASPNWDNGAIADVGAATWASGASGRSGVVSTTNSLVGSSGGDNVGSRGIEVLTNGNYVVRSPNWDNGAIADVGGVTWGSGAGGLGGVVSSANSLVGATAGDQIGLLIERLSNGNYVVCSPNWDNGAIANAGAATWGDGAVGSSGVVSVTNSLVGASPSDQVALNGAIVLTNGNYVVNSYRWDNGAITDAGAATWADGSGPTSGVVSVTNSLVGASANDQVGSGDLELSGGDYVLRTANWDNGAIADAGAATWGDGDGGSSGVVSVTNSLVGATAGDLIGRNALALDNGAYVIASQNWDNGGLADVGAVTRCAAGGCVGVVSAANSLIGASSGDSIGSTEIDSLANGDYVILSPNWDNGAISNAGAVTWVDGAGPSSGVISATNSLVGSSSNDKVGSGGLSRFADSTAVLISPFWDNGALSDAGAVTWSDMGAALTGPIAAAPSSLGIAQLSGPFMRLSGYDQARRRLLVTQSFDNRVIVIDLGPLIQRTYLPMIAR